MRKYKSIPGAFNYSYEDAFTMEDIATRHLYLNQEIDESVVNNIVYHIIRFNRIDKGIRPEERDPIWLYINSPGGALTDGFGLVDAITTSVTPVYTINLALAGSAAFFVFLAGKKRFAMPRSEFLLHEGYMGDVSSISKVHDNVQFMASDIVPMIKEYVISRTSIDERLYESRYRMEWYMLAQEAKTLGVVDSIIGEDCTIEDAL